MKTPKSLIEQFCEAASQHATATESGDYKRGNKAVNRLIEALKQLEAQEATSLLHPLLQNSNIGIRSLAAGYLLRANVPDAETALEAIATQADIHGFTAEITLREWRAGRLLPFF